MDELKTPDKSTEFFRKLEDFLSEHGWVLITMEPHLAANTQLQFAYPSSLEWLFALRGIIEERLTIEAVGYVKNSGR